jgi:hypothetical protein
MTDSECQTSRAREADLAGPGARYRRARPDGRPILPGSMRFATVLSLAPGARAVLFFLGPRRQTTQGVGPENRGNSPGCSEERLDRRQLRRWEGDLVDQLSVTILVIQLDLDQD